MSAFHHCHSTRAPSPNALYWQSYTDAFASNQCVIKLPYLIPTQADAWHRVIPPAEFPLETQVTSQPLEGKSPCSVPRAARIFDLAPSHVTSCPPTSSGPSGGDGPLPLETGTRRRGANRVPRPLNCFFLFKTDWLAKRKSLLAGIEQDHRQLNRMASSEWRKLPPEAKQWFKDAAHQAKVEHSMKYPGYRFTPKPRGDRRKRKTKRNEPEVLLRNEEAARLVSQGVTGDALRGALADYDRRCSDEKQHCTVSTPSPSSLSEGLPSTPSALAPVILPPQPFDANQSSSWAPQPTASFLDLETLWDTLAGNSYTVPWAGEVAQSQQSPVVDGPEIIPAEPAQDSHLIHFDHLPDDCTSFFLPSYSPSTQLFQTGQEIQVDDWSHQLEYLVGGTQGTVSFPVFQPFKPSSDFVQSTSDAGGSAYQSVPLFHAKKFSHTNSPMVHFVPL
jgi:HMG (high mobility group) box